MLVAFQQVMVKWSLATSHLMESYLQVLAMTRRQGYLWSLSFLITGRILIGVRICECIFLQAVLWNMDTFKLYSTLEEHNFLITNVRFSPSSTCLATLSFDKREFGKQTMLVHNLLGTLNYAYLMVEMMIQ